MTIDRALTTEERSWISARLEAVSRFAEAEPDSETAMREIGRILMAHSTSALTQAQAEARADAYEDAVEGIPTWAIVAAHKAWNQGEIDEGLGAVNLSFPPSPGQLAKMARSRLATIQSEAYRLRRLLDAKPRAIKEANPEMLKRLQSLTVAREP